MTEEKKQILKVFFDLMLDDDGELHDEEWRNLIGYKTLEAETKRTRDRLKPDVLELRNEGYLQLIMAVDYDYIPNGSAYDLTEKGYKLVKELFFEKQPLGYICDLCKDTGKVDGDETDASGNVSRGTTTRKCICQYRENLID